MSRTKLISFLLAVSVASGIVGVGCGKDPGASEQRVCTPGNFVFCRCADRSEGTKLCTPNGAAFEECKCGTADAPGPLAPDGDPSFDPVDAGQVPADGPIIDARCTGKLAVLASSDADINLFAAAYAGGGQWKVAKSQGPSLRGMPHGVLVGNVLVAAWRTRFDLIAWTKFEAGQTSLAPPVSIGSASSARNPALAALGSPSSARLFYLGANNANFEGSYTAATGWSNAASAIPAPATDGGVVVPGKSAPAAAAVGASSVIAYSGSNGKLARQMFSGAWGAPLPVAGADAFSQAPAMVAMDGGTKDLLLVYVGTDLLLHFTVREASTKVWGAASLVDSAASPSDAPELAQMPNGRAMLVFKGTDGHAFFTVFDPTKPKPWSIPAPVVATKNPEVLATPTVIKGRCGSDATVTYVEKGGAVNVIRYESNGSWTGPVTVPGMTGMTFAGAGELP